MIGSGASALRPTELAAFATGIIIGGISYHLLLALAYVLLSFVVRSARLWPRVAATVVLLVNAAVSFNGLRSPTVSAVILVMQWATLVLSLTIAVLLVWKRVPVLSMVVGGGLIGIAARSRLIHRLRELTS